MKKSYKAEFCKKELTALLRALDGDIDSAQYRQLNDEEYVIIAYSNRCSKRVCVTADSLLAMARDVLRCI